MSADRAILHSDMNSFYASVEMMLDPKLRGKAVAVCGSTENRHGIVLAKSELAKRAGVKTGMVNWEAKQRCKDLILVPPQYDQYLKYSKLAHEIYYRYTDLVEPFGMDECWLDVTGCEIYGKPLEIAEEIRQSVKEELGLTVSIGVSFNKIFAKLGSDLKKPDAITVITKQNFKENIWPLAASELLYVGSATTKKLASYGIKTIGDLAATEPSTLKYMFGINGLKLWRYANGTDESRVMQKDFVSPVKSIGHGITCTADLDKLLKGFNDFASQYPQLAKEWSEKNKVGADAVTSSKAGLFWWHCLSCGGEYSAWISSRIDGSRCPYCTGRVVEENLNSLSKTHPAIAVEWNCEKNGTITPDQVSALSKQE